MLVFMPISTAIGLEEASVPVRKVRPDLKAIRQVMDAAPLSVGIDPDQEPPSWLAEPARAEWARLMRVCRVRPRWLQEVDVPVVAGWCMAVGLLQEATADVVARGHLIPGRSKSDASRGVANPSVRIALQASSALRSFSAQLGFNPSSRASIPIGPLEDPDADDLFDLGDGSPWS
jgi:P27 family predicted phage terminase small subunit